jgi:MFS family permease
MPKVDWGRYGRRPITLLALVAFIDSVDRGILNGTVSKVQDDLGFSDFQAGLLASIVVVTGMLATLPSGYIADRRTRVRIIAAMLAIWGVISAFNAAVQLFWQFLLVRAVLGVAETIDNPASQSLIADYYPSQLRGRAYAFQRAAPTVGLAAGIGLGGGVAALLSWRWAFLIVGVPGSLLALNVWRLPEPARGEADGTAGEVSQAAGTAWRATVRDSLTVMRIPVLRSVMIGTAISTGATAGFAFWATAFYERHTSLGQGGAAGIVGGIVLLGAVTGTLLGGSLSDRMKATDPSAPMLLAGVSQFIAGLLFAVTFLPVPLWVRLPGQVVAVLLLVAAFPALAAMGAEVVPADLRGIAAAATGLLSAMASALSPLLVGAIADQFKFRVDGQLKGNLADAFLAVTPLILFGASVLLRGRKHLRVIQGATATEGVFSRPRGT